MGWLESLLAMVLVQWLRNHLEAQPLGVVTGPDGTTRLFANTVRAAEWDFSVGSECRTENCQRILCPNWFRILSSKCSVLVTLGARWRVNAENIF